MAWVSNQQRGLVDRRRGSVAWPRFLIGGPVFEWVCVCVCGGVVMGLDRLIGV